MKDLFFKVRLLLRFWRILSKKKFILGEEVSAIEEWLTRYFCVRYALGVASGTDALVLALKAYDIGPEDEVIVPALSFFSTASAVSWVNARPVFVDITLPSLHMDDALIERAITPRSRAIIVAHLNGVIINIEKIATLAKKHNLILIEDYAQAFGARFVDEGSRRYGDVVCLSFNPTKVIHAYGDGGAVLTNDRTIAEKVRQMRMYGTNFENLGKRHPIAGGASRLGVWNAAALNLQLDDFSSIIVRRQKHYSRYLELLNEVAGIVLPCPPQNPLYATNGYRFVVLVKKREALFNYLRSHHIDVQINYATALPFMSAFAFLGHVPGAFPVAERVAREALTLPTDTSLSEDEIGRVVRLMRASKFL